MASYMKSPQCDCTRRPVARRTRTLPHTHIHTFRRRVVCTLLSIILRVVLQKKGGEITELSLGGLPLLQYLLLRRGHAKKMSEDTSKPAATEPRAEAARCGGSARSLVMMERIKEPRETCRTRINRYTDTHTHRQRRGGALNASLHVNAPSYGFISTRFEVEKLSTRDEMEADTVGLWPTGSSSRAEEANKSLSFWKHHAMYRRK